MNPLIQVKQRTPFFLVALLLACFAIPPRARAVESYLIECEFLKSSATVGISGGELTIQEGVGWSHNAQLFWAAPKPMPSPFNLGFQDVTLTLRFNVPAAGTYEIILHYTKAPDYGTVRVSLDGHDVYSYEGYDSKVTLHADSLGVQTLASGTHVLKFKVENKHLNSNGYFVGLDRIDLRPPPFKWFKLPPSKVRQP
jgi:hypothetical protein